MNPTESSLSSVASVVSACISSLSLRGRGRRAVEVKPKDADGDGEAAAVGELATPRRYAHGEEAHGRTSSRRVTVRVPTPENFLLTVDDGSPRQPLRLKPMKCEALVGKPIERANPTAAEVDSYGASVAQWVSTLPWFQPVTLETASDIFLLCVEKRLVETYYSMRLVALAALFAAAKYHELVDSIKLREVVALTEGITARDVRLAEAQLLTILGFDVLAAGRARKPDEDPATPTGVHELVLEDDK
jgi:hypothetical protein